MTSLHDNNVLREILVFTGIDERRDGEEEQEFLQRVVLAVDALPAATWNLLSEEARSWANQGVRILRHNAKANAKDLLDLPGFVPLAINEEFSSRGYPMLRRAHMAWVERNHKPNSVRQVQLKARIKARDRYAHTAKQRVIQLLCERPRITYDELVGLLQREKLPLNADMVRSQYDCVRTTLRTLQDMNRLQQNTGA